MESSALFIVERREGALIEPRVDPMAPALEMAGEETAIAPAPGPSAWRQELGSIVTLRAEWLPLES